MISISVLVFGLFLNSFTSCDITLSTFPPPKQSCKTTLALCKLDAKKLDAALEPGAIGPTGLKGEVGDTGDEGRPGYNGLDGPDGADGFKGEVGEPGSGDVAGVEVAKGQRGNQGTKGSKGKSGEVGAQGSQGLKGRRGDKGAAGMIGSYFTKQESGIVTDGGKEWGSMDSPATVTCKDAPESERTKHTDYYTYYLYIGDMAVTCDFKTNMTCVLIETKLEDILVPYNESKPFWLSQKIALQKIYGVEYDQLNWLQQHSYKANLTIRYHCLNSKPVGSDSISLMLWNDLTVGPEPTNTTLFHYTVLNDSCSSAAQDEWSTTDIMLVSPIAQRLPVIDFLIKDVRNGNQALRIQVLQMCFG